jgi:hypothetical protein
MGRKMAAESYNLCHPNTSVGGSLRNQYKEVLNLEEVNYEYM